LYHEFLGRFRAARLAGDKDPAGYYAARKELEEAARLNPRETDFLTPLIELEETMGFPGARRRVGRLFERAESLSPFNPFFPFEHALLVLSEGDLERASSLMDRAASVEPQFVRAHYFLFKIALSRGEWERVREEACRAVDISESRRGYKTDSLYEAQRLSVPPEELAELRRFWESHGKPGRSGGDAGIERKDVE
jgi:hypothetical protein